MKQAHNEISNRNNMAWQIAKISGMAKKKMGNVAKRNA